jgi:sec-independent protein translocase protein TatA
MNVFGIGLPEMAVIAAIGLLVFGPKRLPELGKTLGKTLRGFQSASQEFEKEFRQAVASESESSGAPSTTTEASPSRSGATEIAVLPGSAPTTEPPAAGTMPAPVLGDTPGS